MMDFHYLSVWPFTGDGKTSMSKYGKSERMKKPSRNKKRANIGWNFLFALLYVLVSEIKNI